MTWSLYSAAEAAIERSQFGAPSSILRFSGEGTLGKAKYDALALSKDSLFAVRIDSEEVTRVWLAAMRSVEKVGNGRATVGLEFRGDIVSVGLAVHGAHGGEFVDSLIALMAVRPAIERSAVSSGDERVIISLRCARGGAPMVSWKSATALQSNPTGDPDEIGRLIDDFGF